MRSAFLGALARVRSHGLQRRLHNVPSWEALGVAEKVLEGELLFREGELSAGLQALEEAVEREDGLPYDEPWGWMVPSRHALGALTADAARLHQERGDRAAAMALWARAMAVYSRDLELRPANVWALTGLARCFSARAIAVSQSEGCLQAAAARAAASDLAEAAALEAAAVEAGARSDGGPVKAACFCAMEAGAPPPAPLPAAPEPKRGQTQNGGAAGGGAAAAAEEEEKEDEEACCSAEPRS